MTQRQMENHLKLLLHAKELSRNLHFDTFFHLRRTLSAGGGPGTVPLWPPVHVSARDSTFLHQTIGLHSCPTKGADGAQERGSGGALLSTTYSQICQKCELGKITFSFTQYKKKWNLKQVCSASY